MVVEADAVCQPGNEVIKIRPISGITVKFFTFVFECDFIVYILSLTLFLQ